MEVGGYSDWTNAAINSKSFESFKVYIIRCYNDNEEFIKIGRTFSKLNKRFEGTSKLPYSYEIIYIKEFSNQQTITNNSIECCEFEKNLHKKLKSFKYNPLLKFNGYTECFNNDSLELIKEDQLCLF